MVRIMSPDNELQQSNELARVQAALETHNIPIQQPTTSLIFSHIGLPRLGVMAKWIRKGNGMILLAFRVILIFLSSIAFFIAAQQGYTGVTLSGDPWLPLTEVIGAPLDLLAVLLSAYILVPINLILGQLILLYLDLPMYWLFKNDSRQLWLWVIISTFVWFTLAMAIGLFIEGAITWGVVLFPEIVSQLYIVLLVGVFTSGMIELVLLFALTREIIRVSRPMFLQLEGRFMAVRDYVTKRPFMRKPFSSLFDKPSTSINQSIFIRESLMNWIRALILVIFGMGVAFVLPDFGALSSAPLIESIVLTLVGLAAMGLVLYIVINGLKRGIRTYWSAFLFMTFVITVEAMFLSLFCGFNFALASMIAGLLSFAILSLKVRQMIDENPGVLTTIYFRYLLGRMSTDEAHDFIEDTLNQLSEVLPHQV